MNKDRNDSARLSAKSAAAAPSTATSSAALRICKSRARSNRSASSPASAENRKYGAIRAPPASAASTPGSMPPRRAIGDQHHKGALEQIVVEGARCLGGKERHEAPRAQ